MLLLGALNSGFFAIRFCLSGLVTYTSIYFQFLIIIKKIRIEFRFNPDFSVFSEFVGGTYNSFYILYKLAHIPLPCTHILRKQFFRKVK